MKIILSPAKKMNIDDEYPFEGTEPCYLEEAKRLCQVLREMSLSELQKLWKCNDSLAELNYQRLQEMDFSRRVTPAVFAYEGLAFQHMGPKVLSEAAFAYLSSHLRILSGFYGVLAPFDLISPYRLEMQAKLATGGHKDLYGFWGSRLYDAVLDEDRTIINLASKEYSQAVEKYLIPEDTFITIEFCELVAGKPKQKGTYAKMARGEMVRYMADNQIGRDQLEQLKDYQRLGFSYSSEWSEKDRLVFIRKP